MFKKNDRFFQTPFNMSEKYLIALKSNAYGLILVSFRFYSNTRKN
ncbi:hypothetical protein HMPREF0027_2427 [Actinobacillus ureae ATCC 25976]|uniref:Uncharacterized protein n=1 Tax=Actinobacillus ureae ATCC 25976 TaxID=887324 RepID=E8KKR0_9PAST|nr:hypothetical protein HMPREF0027_2427 [Actinobacillus ureae ATCC 25976]